MSSYPPNKVTIPIGRSGHVYITDDWGFLTTTLLQGVRECEGAAHFGEGKLLRHVAWKSLEDWNSGDRLKLGPKIMNTKGLNHSD